MAIDTRDKRSSAIGVSLPWRGMFPVADGSLSSPGDRLHVALLYRLIVGARSMQQQCIDAIYDDIRALITAGTISGSIAGMTITTSDVYKRRVVSTRGETRTIAIVVGTPLDIPELMLGGTNEQEDIGFPVLVGVFAPCNNVMTINNDSDTFWLWRETIMRRYQGQCPISVPGVYHTKAEPQQIVARDQFVNNLLAGGVLVRCIARLARV